MPRTLVTGAGLKSMPFGLVDRAEQPDGDYQDNCVHWMCNVSWKQLQPDFQGQALQGSKTLIGQLTAGLGTGQTTALVRNMLNPSGRVLQVAGGVDLTNVPTNMKNATGGIFSDGYNGVLLDDGAGHTQFLVLATDIAQGAVTIKCSDCMPSWSYPAGTNVYYLTGTAWSDEALRWADLSLLNRVGTYGRMVDLVVFAGNLAPVWAKQIQPAGAPKLTDGVTAASPHLEYNINAATEGLIGAVWDANYQAAVQDLFSKLGARYDLRFALGVVRCTMAGTTFMEPCVRSTAGGGAPGNGNGATLESLRVSGYTHAADIAMQGNYMDAIKLSFLATPVNYSFNSFQHVQVETSGDYPVSSITAGPNSVINYTGIDLSGNTYGTSTSCAFLKYYAGRVSWTATNPGGATSFVDDAGATNALQAGYVGKFVLICNKIYTIGAINTGTGQITLTGALDSSGSNAPIDGNYQGHPYWIVPFSTVNGNQFAVSSANANPGLVTNASITAPDLTNLKVSVLKVSNTDETVTATLMDTFRTKLGVRAVIQNNSVAADNAPPAWGGQSPFADVASRGAPIGTQTQADSGMNGSTTTPYLGFDGYATGDRSIRNALAMGARWIELPKGYILNARIQINASSGNAIGIKNHVSDDGTVTVTSPNFGTNRWTNGPGMFGWFIFETSGNLYLVVKDTNSVITGTGMQVVDSGVQSSAALTGRNGSAVDIASGDVITSLGCSGTMAKATTAGDIVLIRDSATGNMQAYVSSGSLAGAASISVSGQPLGTGSAANAAYPRATTTIFYCPLATADRTNALFGRVYGWDYISPARALAFADACRRSAGALGRSVVSSRPLAASRLLAASRPLA